MPRTHEGSAGPLDVSGFGEGLTEGMQTADDIRTAMRKSGVTRVAWLVGTGTGARLVYMVLEQITVH